jgi:hypothetical protein
MGIPVLTASGPASGTYTKNNAANRIGVYMWAGGGGNSPAFFGCVNPGTGGKGGMGFYNFPTTSPFSQPYSVGGGGNSGNMNAPGPNNPGNAGGNTTVANVGTVNGGGAGNGSSFNPGTPGAAGNQPGASLAYNIRSFVVGAVNTGEAGVAGALIIYENTGT